MRAILHSDMNCFYASVEMMLDPALRGKAVAVCGSTEDRHGIVLAKSELAKRAGVKTGMVNWEAKQWCPNLIMVKPQYEQYMKYSRLARDIYGRYTDQVEPYGMDECFLDITGSRMLHGEPMKIAEEIRTAMREELGLTVSIGVSFNKTFAKLGSDMKKPDAITQITPDNYTQKVWPLPASDLLYVGRATTKKLADRGIHSIGDLAAASPDGLKALLGINGVVLGTFANGQDQSRVMHKDFVSPVKSVGHGITCNADLVNDDEVDKVILYLCQDIGHKLRVHELRARGVQLATRDSNLWCKQYQAPLLIATQNALEIAHKARELFHANYQWSTPLRSVTVRAIRLAPASQPIQQFLFDDSARRDKTDRLEDAVDDIRRRFGKKALLPASIIGEMKIPDRGIPEITMPGMMYM